MDNTFLTINGQKELQKYLNFFNLKKQTTMKDIEMDFEEFHDTQVTDTLFNKDDVTEIIRKLSKQVQQQIEKDFSKMIHMSGVYVKIFLCEAQQQGIDFHADYNFIENLKIMEEMKVLEKGGSLVTGEQEVLKSKTVYSRLPTIDSTQQNKIDQHGQEIERLNQYNSKLQNELITMKRASVSDKLSLNDAGSLEKEVQALRIQNQELEAESQKKIQDTVQFKNLKTMVQQKNEIIKDLTSKLTKYGEVI